MIHLIPSFLIINIPAGISIIVLVGLFIAGIAEFRQGYIGRVAIFLNALLLWEIFFGIWGSLPQLFQLYLNIGSIVGLIAIISYFPRISLPKEFYTFCYIFYGSISIIVAVIGALYLKIPLI